MKRTTLIALAGLALSCSTHAASFDGAKAQMPVEKLICSDAELSKLDDDLDAAHTKAVKVDGKAESFRLAQKQWLKERNACVDATCVKNAYQNRLRARSPCPPTTQRRCCP